MKFLKVVSHSADETRIAFRNYERYLEQIRSGLAPNVYEFASASWHYDFADHRCPHDAWLETVTISERKIKREPLDISLTLLGAYHDGRMRLTYRSVQKYELLGRIPNQSHGDWLIDEITLSDKGQAVHEIAFSSGSTMYLEFSDLTVDWTAA